MSEITVHSRMIVSNVAKDRMKSDDYEKIIRSDLVHKLAELILEKKEVFTQENDVRYDQTIYKADCYVLSENDFRALVDRIRNSIRSEYPSVIGSPR